MDKKILEILINRNWQQHLILLEANNPNHLKYFNLFIRFCRELQKYDTNIVRGS